MASALLTDLVEFSKYHNDAADGIARLLHGQFDGNSSRFVGTSLREFNELLQARESETELRSCLALLAFTEAQLRVDFRIRMKKRKKDPLSRDIRSQRKKLKQKIRFDDLLTLWIKHHPESKRILGELRAALHFRHWLAHGRYWPQPTGRFDYTAIYDLVAALLNSLPLLTGI
jgi:hypothetical protein